MRCKQVGPRPYSTPLAIAGKALQIACQEYSRIVRGGPPLDNNDNRQSAFLRSKLNYEMAQQMYGTAKKQAADLRESEQQLTVEEYARTNNMEKAAVVPQMAQREKAKSIFQKLSYYNGKAHTPLKQILVLDHPDDMESTTWTEVVEATAIWEALLNNGRAHFSQATDTPFVTGPVANLIGPYNFNEHAQDILNGTFNIDSITDDIELRDVVKAMRYDDPSNPPNIDCSISIEQLKQGFKDTNESTSSSPTGLHYGHWKSLLHDDDLFLPYGLMIIFAGKFGIPPLTVGRSCTTHHRERPRKPQDHQNATTMTT